MDFDLAKQVRIAERNKRFAQRLGRERVLREQRLRCWGVAFAIAAICITLTVAMNIVPKIVNLIR